MSVTSKQLQSARLDELAVLVEVAESGSLSAAAKKLNVPKSTVGRAIRRIEDELGVALVRRMAKGAVLTQPGRVLADRAAPHIAALRDARTALDSDANEAFGVLRIATLADVSALLLAPLLPGFLAQHPRVRPELSLSLHNVDLIRDGFDVGVRVSMRASLPSSSLIAKKLGPANLGLYASPNYAARRELPKRPHDLLEHDAVLFFPGETNQIALTGPKGSVKLTLRGRVSGNDFFFCRAAIDASLGIGMLPWFMARPELEAGRMVRVLPDYIVTLGSMFVMYPPAKPLSPKVEAFTSYLRAHVPRLLGE
ncbi:MAG TPA: LysR family transcriptional regulator [Kofleriaceae bacterium]|jgi:DNA-binding transcriptional LysR family regulator